MKRINYCWTKSMSNEKKSQICFSCLVLLLGMILILQVKIEFMAIKNLQFLLLASVLQNSSFGIGSIGKKLIIKKKNGNVKI